MLSIKNYEKMVGTVMVMHNFNVPSPLLEWECEKVIEFPDFDKGNAYGMPSYRFEYKAKSDYDVPLCIYLERISDETGNYKMYNNLMDNENKVLASAIANKTIFEKVLVVYCTEVIMKWAKDQKMI